MDINPEIRVFWEKIGKIENDTLLSAPVSCLYWVVYPDIYPDGDDFDSTAIYIASLPSDQENITYYINGKACDEAIALRLIKLSAFW